MRNPLVEGFTVVGVANIISGVLYWIVGVLAKLPTDIVLASFSGGLLCLALAGFLHAFRRRGP